MPGDLSAKLIIMDTGPLITLAAADCLDYLLYPGVPVYVPDAVLYEATRDSAALGAPAILDWAQRNSETVHTISTETFFNYIQSQEVTPGRREKDLGERAAIEAIHDGLHLTPEERAILITEDDRVLRRVLVLEAELTAKMIPITTHDFLIGMEQARRINSADEVYRRAEDAGRLASQRQSIKDQHEHAREAVARMVRRSLPDP
ncbi:MAG TPA: hypothetical protein VIK30_14045 [Polyangia bacterium]